MYHIDSYCNSYTNLKASKAISHERRQTSGGRHSSVCRCCAAHRKSEPGLIQNTHPINKADKTSVYLLYL